MAGSKTHAVPHRRGIVSRHGSATWNRRTECRWGPVRARRWDCPVAPGTATTRRVGSGVAAPPSGYAERYRDLSCTPRKIEEMGQARDPRAYALGPGDRADRHLRHLLPDHRAGWMAAGD